MGRILTVSMVAAWWASADKRKPRRTGVLLPQTPQFGLHSNSCGAQAVWGWSLEHGKKLGWAWEKGSRFPW